MNKMILSWVIVILMTGMFAFSATTTEAKNINNLNSILLGEQDFELVNKTGVEINALYVTPHNAKDWGEDILGVDTLAAGDSVEIHFSRSETAKYWDLRVEDEDGAYIEWDSLNLLKISTVELYYKNGKATAIVK